MTREISLSGTWELTGGDIRIEGRVPGDVTDDLYRAGIIPDPYWGRNHQACGWAVERNWTYRRTFVVGEEEPFERAVLCLAGVDTFAEVELNGVSVGRTENMHQEYRFDVQKVLRRGENDIRIHLKNIRDAIPAAQTRYDCIFHPTRLLARKAQCHFGWDWAPKLPGYGVYREVSLLLSSGCELEELKIKASADGRATFYLGTDRRFEGTLSLEILDEGRPVSAEKRRVCGRRTILSTWVREVKPWWPAGYGEPHLYEYRIVYRKPDGAEEISCRGTFGFKDVVLETSALDSGNLDFCFRINGRRVFARGSNWVPAECMTGRLTQGKLEALLRAAGEANFNMLRVWGGGIYESDLFYDLCDRLGIMVWQDFMFACSEIPEDDTAFVQTVIREAEYQIRRLRNHPCITYWCGMNENRGAFSEYTEERYSRQTTRYLLRGLVADLDEKTPYGRTSPYAFADTENDCCEGDSHNNLSELCLFGAPFKGFDRFEYGQGLDEESIGERLRRFYLYLEPTRSNFSSECAVLGACSRQSLERFCPPEERSLDSEFLLERFMGNPYTYVMPDFFERQKRIASALYGQAESLPDLLKKVNLAQADMMRAEIVYARANGRSNGFLSWMFNDIWPTGTWSVIDWYLDKKPAYYEMKRRFKPRMAAFERLGSGKSLVLVNDLEETAFTVEIGLGSYGGEERPLLTRSGLAAGESVLRIPAETSEEPDYLYARGTFGGQPLCETLDLNRYFSRAQQPLFRWRTEEGMILLEGERYCPCLYIAGCEPEDNYFELRKGERRRIRLKGTSGEIKQGEIKVLTSAEPW